MSLEERTRRKDALKWLAVVRRADLDDATAAAYLTGVSDLPAWAVEKACKQIGFSERGEYEDKWPELARIRSVAQAAIRADVERAQSERLLASHRQEPADPSRLAQFLADVKAEVARKTMR